ncbi:MAG: Choline-sulfatase, partial [Betaproteobacteria bacterium]|nr:Choline-sulfatase [Betaproteobacteria bacterium]
LDHNVGRVLGALDEAGLSGSTRVLYGSDHGENLGARGLWGKWTMFEETAGIPLILAGPDVPAGRVMPEPVSLVDVFPTVLQCAGVAPHRADSDLPGTSLLAAAQGKLPKRTILSEYHAVASPSGSFMIRRGPFKYIHYCGYAPMLFDLEHDPYERNDLAALPEYREVLAACRAELREIVDPDAIDRLAHADQRATVQRMGGKDAIMQRGAVSNSPPPGVASTRIPVERA